MYPIYPYIGQNVKLTSEPVAFPPQHQERQPGLQWKMIPQPISENPGYRPAGKLAGKTALITGGDSGIGRAAAILFAKEGADIAIAYYDESRDANDTKQRIEQLGRSCVLISTDLRQKVNCIQAVDTAVQSLGRLNILVNNHAIQFVQDNFLDITEEQLLLTYQTNILSYFYLIQAALPHMKRGDAIINTASITAYQGNKKLIDYSSTKGAIVSLTRSLALSLAEEGIRVNSVAPGPVWTPLIPASFSAEDVAVFGTDTPLRRAAQPFEIAPAYVYLASDDSGYVTGQTIHVNGGDFVTS